VIEVHAIAAQFMIAVASRVGPASPSLRSMHIEHVAVIVDDYDRAIEFFVEVLGFELVDDTPSLTNDGRPKRWVVVRPPAAQTGVLLARADGEDQRVAVGTSSLGASGCSSESTTSRLPMRAWSIVVSSLSGRPETSPTGESRCSSTSPGTSGTCSARHDHDQHTARYRARRRGNRGAGRSRTARS
jgi:Glyoxalase/Bleomycin resistance protein/Dioxygenase superfamily